MRRGAAWQYPVAANNPAWFGGTEHNHDSEMVKAATQTTAVQTPDPRRHRSTTVALRCPLPPSSDSDDSEPDPPAVNYSRKKQSLNKIQRPNMLQEKISHLATLSNHQVQSVEPSTEQQLALPAVLKNQLQSRWVSVVKDAILDGDWKAVSSLACPVIVSNGNAIWEPHEWKILQSAKQTVTIYGIRGDVEDSLQTLELKAIGWAFQTWNKEPLNVVSDSLYVVGVVQRIEDALLRRTQNQHLGELFLQLRSMLKQRQHVFCIMHIRSHQCNRGLGGGNALADAAVSYAVHVPPQNSFERARNSHEIVHQNVRAMH
ncbi:hypothetical protein DV515_00012212 [Chloebia gouldiae]|uniref:RNase H type-1 domain-containing protein n=1 Tax=Chloebia gouldiae TaxID=44316 RepID=A0A3L8S5E2_CHLGU|nr:hypothetical protein DV515_00012212 [Chloebia gouldiae]